MGLWGGSRLRPLTTPESRLASELLYSVKSRKLNLCSQQTIPVIRQQQLLMILMIISNDDVLMRMAVCVRTFRP